MLSVPITCAAFGKAPEYIEQTLQQECRFQEYRKLNKGLASAGHPGRRYADRMVAAAEQAMQGQAEALSTVQAKVASRRQI